MEITLDVEIRLRGVLEALSNDANTMFGEETIHDPVLAVALISFDARPVEYENRSNSCESE